MKNNRLIFYLLINIIVSALTTLAVLLLWNQFHQLKTVSLASDLFPTATSTDTIQATLPPTGAAVLQIDNVYGVGRWDSEMVVVKRVGEGELWLSGWKMVDEQNHQFVFPQLLLNNNGNVNIYTRGGVDTARDLHWGKDKAMWQTGEKVRILDSMGNLRAEYTIP